MKQFSDKQLNSFYLLRTMQSGFMETFNKKIAYVESEHISLINCIFTFIACLLLRDFLEAFIATARNFFNADSLSVLVTIVHFNSFYLAIALSLSIGLHFVTKTPMVSVLKVILPCFILLSIAPIIDYFFPFTEVYGYTYFSPYENYSLFYSYLTYFGQFSGATIGMKIEIFAALIGVFLYGYDKTRHCWKALFGCWLAYTIIFFFAASLFIMKEIFNIVDNSFIPTEVTLISYYFILNFLLGLWVLYLSNKNNFKSLLSEIPILRVLHYEIMFMLGLCMAIRTSNFELNLNMLANPAILRDILFIVIATLFASLFAMTINNLEDIEIDKISNADRALASGKISKEMYNNIAYTCLGLSLIYAAPAGIQSVFFMMLFMGIYYLYSALPLRMKRITIFSKLAISVNSLLLLLLGFWVVRNNFSVFNHETINMTNFAALFVLFTLAANFIDLKDAAGDKSAGIQTLPVVAGMRQAQYFCGLAFFLSYAAMAVILPVKPLLSGIIVLGGGIQFYLLTRKKYNETPVLLFYVGSLLLLMVTMVANGNIINVYHDNNPTAVTPYSPVDAPTNNPKIPELIIHFNNYFKTNMTSIDQLKPAALARVNKFYAAVRNCTPGTYQYILQYMPGVVFYTSVIKGKENGICLVESTFTIPGKTQGNKTCRYRPASRLLFTEAQAAYDGSGKFEFDHAHLTAFQQVEIDDCRFTMKLLDQH